MKKFLLSFSGLFVAVLLIGQGCSQAPAETNTNSAPTPVPSDTTASNTLSDRVAEADEETAATTSVEVVPADSGADTSESGSTVSGAVKEFTITARKFEFEPATITVNEGDQVALTITSEDVEHGFSLPDFGVSEQLEPGETVEVEFVADAAGTYSFFCHNFCGSGHGNMKGTLVVQ